MNQYITPELMKERINEFKEYKPITDSFGLFKGLRFSKSQKVILCLKKERKVKISNWFVFFTTKVKFLNSQFETVEETVLKPFRTYKTTKTCCYIAESPL